jgi:hypothetical protein
LTPFSCPFATFVFYHNPGRKSREKHPKVRACFKKTQPGLSAEGGGTARRCVRVKQRPKTEKPGAASGWKIRRLQDLQVRPAADADSSNEKETSRKTCLSN